MKAHEHVGRRTVMKRRVDASKQLKVESGTTGRELSKFHGKFIKEI